MAPVLTYNLAVLTIAALYYVWRELFQLRVKRQKLVCERVAYMLWAAASRTR